MDVEDRAPSGAPVPPTPRIAAACALEAPPAVQVNPLLGLERSFVEGWSVRRPEVVLHMSREKEVKCPAGVVNYLQDTRAAAHPTRTE